MKVCEYLSSTYLSFLTLSNNKKILSTTKLPHLHRTSRLVLLTRMHWTQHPQRLTDLQVMWPAHCYFSLEMRRVVKLFLLGNPKSNVTVKILSVSFKTAYFRFRGNFSSLALILYRFNEGQRILCLCVVMATSFCGLGLTLSTFVIVNYTDELLA